MTMILATPLFMGGARSRSCGVVSLPFHILLAVPFTLLKRPPVRHRSGGSRPNWDGTPARSSGVRGRSPWRSEAAWWRQRGGAA